MRDVTKVFKRRFKLSADRYFLMQPIDREWYIYYLLHCISIMACGILYNIRISPPKMQNSRFCRGKQTINVTKVKTQPGSHSLYLNQTCQWYFHWSQKHWRYIVSFEFTLWWECHHRKPGSLKRNSVSRVFSKVDAGTPLNSHVNHSMEPWQQYWTGNI